jgi:hypothetical protein
MSEQPEHDNISVNCDGLEFKVVFPGTFEDDSGKSVEYGESIKLGNGKVAFKVSAHGLAMLVQAVRSPEVLPELKRRLELEKKERAGVGF